MRQKRALAIISIGISLGFAAAVHGQALRNNAGPAEYPPASFTGAQYVDSKGCVYIRAGVDGNVTWVPRVTRDRKVVCGYQPSVPDATASALPAPKLDKNVEIIVPDTPVTTTSATTTQPVVAPPPPKPTPVVIKPAPTTTTAPTTTPTTTTVAPPPAATTTSVSVAPAANTTTAPTATTTTPRRTTTQPVRASGSASPCRDVSPISQQYMTSSRGDVRCGPQAELPYTPGTGGPISEPPVFDFQRDSSVAPGAVGTVGTLETLPRNARVVPRHVYESPSYTVGLTRAPAGYRRVFEDGRLNARRAEMSVSGIVASNQFWTRSLPREGLAAPVTSAVVVSTQSGIANTAAATTAPNPAAVVSTRSAPVEKTLRLSGSHYVQVETYSEAEAAQRAARQIKRLGLPVRIGKYDRGGVTHRIVLAGPFADAGSVQKGLSRVQGAGYARAFVRK